MDDVMLTAPWRLDWVFERKGFSKGSVRVQVNSCSFEDHLGQLGEVRSSDSMKTYIISRPGPFRERFLATSRPPLDQKGAHPEAEQVGPIEVWSTRRAPFLLALRNARLHRSTGIQNELRSPHTLSGRVSLGFCSAVGHAATRRCRSDWKKVISGPSHLHRPQRWTGFFLRVGILVSTHTAQSETQTTPTFKHLQAYEPWICSACGMLVLSSPGKSEVTTQMKNSPFFCGEIIPGRLPPGCLKSFIFETRS